MAASVPYQPYIILCPAAFTTYTGGKVKHTSLSGVKDTKQSEGTSLDDMESTGAVLLHEFTHAVIGTNSLSTQGELYGQLNGRLYAKMRPDRVRKNADTFSMYGKACYLEQNAWVTGKAEDKTKYDTEENGSGSQPPGGGQGSGGTVRRHRRLSNNPFYARRLDNSTTTNVTGTGIVTISTFSKSASTSGLSTSSRTVPSSSSIFTSSDSGKATPGTSSYSTSSSSVGATSSLNTTSNGTSTMSLPSSSSSLNNVVTTSMTFPGSSPLLASSSTAIPGIGTLPFSDTTGSSSPSSIPTLSWSGSWTDTTTPTPVDFTFFNIPTTVMSDQAATSEAVLLGSLFSALQANRKRLTDANLKSQYLEDVKRTRDETQALFNGLKIKPDMNDCKNTKRKRNSNALSERQVRDLLRNRGLIDGIEKAIKGAINDVSKLISCSLNIVNNLVDTVKGDTPDINLVENLTDALAEIGTDLEEEDNLQSSTQEPSSTTTASESSSSHSSSSSCTGSTVIPICTETVSLSTSVVSDTSIATIGTITQTSCLTTTVTGCTASGTTSVMTASSNSSATNSGDGTPALFYFPTDAPDQTSLPPESVSWLATAFLDEYTESISYNGTTAGPATSTAAGIQTSAVSSTSSTLATKTSVTSPSSSTVLPLPSPTTAPAPAPIVTFSQTCSNIGNIKWVARDAAIDHINTFCADAAKQGVQDPNSGSLARTYDGNLVLSIDWPPGTPFPPDCSKFMPAIVDSCGSGAPNNPMNWKHGGVVSNGQVRYSVTPTQTRYVHGRCKVHVREKETWHWEANRNQRLWKFWDDISGYDSQGTLIGGSGGDVYSADDDPAVLKGVFYDDMKLTDESKNDYIQFNLGQQAWTSSDSQCSVGAFDSKYSPATRQMDCTFDC